MGDRAGELSIAGEDFLVQGVLLGNPCKFCNSSSNARFLYRRLQGNGLGIMGMVVQQSGGHDLSQV